MYVAVVAVLCMQIAKGPLSLDTDCAPQEQSVEEVVTDSTVDEFADFFGCMIQGQIGVADWKAHHPIYHSDHWRVARIKCVPGHYEIKGRA